MDYTGRHAVVLGLGLTGFSLARHLAAHGAAVRVADTRTSPPFAANLAAALPGVEVAAGPYTAQTFAGADLVAISPGVAKDQPAIAAAVAGGAELVGDIELFARALPPEQKVLAITGSNGKSTVTALTGALCRAGGLATVVAGNIGDAVLDTLPADNDWNGPQARSARCPPGGSTVPFGRTGGQMNDPHAHFVRCPPGGRAVPFGRPGGHWPDVYVLELSSFQLETTSALAPTAATVLNVTDNHLDRYAGMDEYAAAKARIFHGGGIQVLNREDPRSLALGIPGRVVQTFGGGVPESEEAWGLVDRGAARDGQPETWLARGGALLVPVADLKLVGRHNALNALAALALASAVAKIDHTLLAALTGFEGLPHRMQKVAEAGGVLFVDDSKGTTVAATRAALAGLSRPVVLIAGGDGKGQDFAPLAASVDERCRAVLLIGRDAPAIERALAGTAAAIECVGTLDAAVARAMQLATPGDAVVLSPACASLDQFANYVERGEQYRRCVLAQLAEDAHA